MLVTTWSIDVGFILNPGASGTVSSVVQNPPTMSRASRTTTRLPARARNVAQTSPLWPPPTTATS